MCFSVLHIFVFVSLFIKHKKVPFQENNTFLC
nr:MAG TPA: hypothetical protein [Caudoviricetes sp.]